MEEKEIENDSTLKVIQEEMEELEIEKDEQQNEEEQEQEETPSTNINENKKNNQNKKSDGHSKGSSKAKKTLEILNNGFYFTPKGKKVICKDEIQSSISGTILYRDSEEILSNIPQDNSSSSINPLQRYSQPCEIVLQQSSTLECAAEYATCSSYASDSKSVAVLNFASAKNPGGGFLGGARAQEESLARSSGLYLCLKPQTEHYKKNKLDKTCIYTHNIIYSPSVIVFKNDEGLLLESPYYVSFISAPAPNAGAAINRISQATHGMNAADFIQKTLQERADRVLAIAAKHSHPLLILGAWGCGVFKNSPQQVASTFHSLIVSKYQHAFQKVVFAVLDQNTCDIFAKILSVTYEPRSQEWKEKQNKTNSYNEFNKKGLNHKKQEDGTIQVPEKKKKSQKNKK